MKKIIHGLLITLFFSVHFQTASAQKKISEGKATFDITYPDADIDQERLAMMPGESVMYFKGDMSRTEVKMAMGNTVVITNGKLGESTTLMNMMDGKYAIRTTKEDIAKLRSKKGIPKPEVQVTDETKTIAGHLCKKATLTVKDESGKVNSVDVWFTKDITAPNSIRKASAGLEAIDGFLMEFQVKQSTLAMKMTCRSVEEIKTEDSMFVIPADYKTTTMEELMKSMGGSGH